jgi:hypothetical protein
MLASRDTRLYTLLEEGIESEDEDDSDFSCYVEKRVIALVGILFVFIIGLLVAFYYL